jgi:hypothetical protein
MARQDSKFEIIQYKLDAIKEQTTKTNGRVTIMETTVNDLQKHPLSCGLAVKMRSVEDALLAQKSIKQWVIGSVAATSGFLGLIALILKLTGLLN